MQTIKAIYDGFVFKPQQPIPVQGHYDVVITFLEPITKWADKVHIDEKRIDCLNRLEAALELIDDEDLSDFPSQGLMKFSHDDWFN